MFGCEIAINCYIDMKENRVMTSLDTHKVPGHVIESYIICKCCCYSTYYNKETREFSVHPGKDLTDWIELPWDEWIDVDNPDETNTFTHRAKIFANRVMGQ